VRRLGPFARTNSRCFRPSAGVVGHKSAAAVAGVGHKTPREFYAAIHRERWLPSPTMSALPERRTRPTIRCLRGDLGAELPTVDVDLGSIEHPLMDEARRLAPTAPQGQKRVLAIDHPLVYRLRHGRWRGATWLEEDAARFWLLAGALRAAGSREDAYEGFVALHEAGELLPSEDDQLRDVLERDARVLSTARADAPPALVAAAAAPDRDLLIRFGELVDVRLLVSAAGDEVWVAIATRAVDGAFVVDGLREVRALLFARTTRVAGRRSDPRAASV
jgi:hypothetical protein